jgi:hypothetical protein
MKKHDDQLNQARNNMLLEEVGVFIESLVNNIKSHLITPIAIKSFWVLTIPSTRRVFEIMPVRIRSSQIRRDERTRSFLGKLNVFGQISKGCIN